MLRYKLRTLLILLAVGPPILAGAWFTGAWMLSQTPIGIRPMLIVGTLSAAPLGIYVLVLLAVLISQLQNLQRRQEELAKAKAERDAR